MVRRDGSQVTVPVDPRFVRLLSSSQYARTPLISERIPYVVAGFRKGSPAADQDQLREGDQIVSFDGQPVAYFHDFASVSRNKFNAVGAQPTELGFVRDGQEMTVTLTHNDNGQFGIIPKGPTYFFDYETREYSFLASLPAGVRKGWNFLDTQFKAFGQMFKGKIKASESLGGFGTITKLFPDTWQWPAFWNVTAILSLILAVMNLLPIPALDGGHVMFLMYEVVTGRKPSDKFMERATIIGFAIVLALVLYANGLDIWRWLSGKFG